VVLSCSDRGTVSTNLALMDFDEVVVVNLMVLSKLCFQITTLVKLKALR
jgi:hypothetical protein